MKDRKLTDHELGTFAKTVVTAGSNARVVEGLISDPKLYNGVLAKIAAEVQAEAGPSRFAWKPVAAFAAAVICVSASFVIYFGSGTEAPRANITNVPDKVVDIKPHLYIGSSEEPTFSTGESKVIKAVAKRPFEKPRTANVLRAKRTSVKDADPVFHPIGFAERAEDAAIDGRVVRVEMPRSALFALGVDLPLENGTRSVKADLLVGADGSPRAIRLVE